MTSGKLHNVQSIALKVLFQLSNFRYLTLSLNSCQWSFASLSNLQHSVSVLWVTVTTSEQHRDPYGWIYCSTELNKQHNIHKIIFFFCQKYPNDSHTLHMQLIQTSLPVKQFSHCWIYSARTEPFSLADLRADRRTAQPLEHVLCAYWIFHESHIKSAGFEVHWGADIFTLPDQHHPYLS